MNEDMDVHTYYISHLDTAGGTRVTMQRNFNDYTMWTTVLYFMAQFLESIYGYAIKDRIAIKEDGEWIPLSEIDPEYLESK